MAFLSLLEAGVFERHPTLRVAFLEAGCGLYALLAVAPRRDGIRADQKRARRHVRQRPSAYFRRQIMLDGCCLSRTTRASSTACRRSSTTLRRPIGCCSAPTSAHIDHDHGHPRPPVCNRSNSILRPEILRAAVFDNAARLLGQPSAAAVPRRWPAPSGRTQPRRLAGTKPSPSREKEGLVGVHRSSAVPRVRVQEAATLGRSERRGSGEGEAASGGTPSSRSTSARA